MIGTREANTSTPPVRGVEIWFADLAKCSGALEAIEQETPRLSNEDCARLEQTTGAEERRWRRAAHIALRIFIERAFGPQWRNVPYVFGETGKLALPGSNGDFSLAHTGGFALIGVNRKGRIGVDLEKPRDIDMASNRQQVIIKAAARLVPTTALPEDPTAGFIQAWVRLEALAKADGHGIGHVLTELGTRGQKDGASRIASLLEQAYSVVDLELGPDFFGAAALGGAAESPLTVSHLPADARALSDVCNVE